MSDFKIDDLVEIQNLIRNIELNGRTGTVCKDISNDRYGIKLENESKIKLIKYENLRHKIDISSKNTELFVNPINSDINLTEPKIKLESDEIQIPKQKYNWCLHEDCLESVECFSSHELLTNHMTIHN